MILEKFSTVAFLSPIMAVDPRSSFTMAQDIPFELESLANAKRYQRWIYDEVKAYLGQRILELGSGIGNLSQHLPLRERLILSDIEPHLLAELRKKVPEKDHLSIVQVSVDQALNQRFGDEDLDTIVSFNVLEHVEDDVALFRDALALLRKSKAPGKKRIVTLVPAHPFAFGAIDKKFGHFRRYSNSSFKKLVKKAAGEEYQALSYKSFYMNIPALLGWWLNGRVLGKADIGSGNMELFEKLCPLIRPVDEFLHKALKVPFGNSLVTIVELR